MEHKKGVVRDRQFTYPTGQPLSTIQMLQSGEAAVSPMQTRLPTQVGHIGIAAWVRSMVPLRSQD